MTLRDCEELAQIAAECHGDHVEIGTAYGGSAILVALAKREFGTPGKVFCVDPGYSATEATVIEMLRKFEVENVVVLTPTKSYPWPLSGQRFASALIDGDHSGDQPVQDWLSVHPWVDGCIMFHDYAPGKRSVKRAGDYARADPHWETVVDDPPCLILRRIQ